MVEWLDLETHEGGKLKNGATSPIVLEVVAVFLPMESGAVGFVFNIYLLVVI